jgi:hypothetical protein
MRDGREKQYGRAYLQFSARKKSPRPHKAHASSALPLVHRPHVADNFPQLVPVFALAVRRQLVERAALMPDRELAAPSALDAGAGECEGGAAAGASKDL